MVKGDEINVIVTIFNNLNANITAPVSISLSDSLTYSVTDELNIVAPHSNTGKLVSLIASNISDEAVITFTVNGSAIDM